MRGKSIIRDKVHPIVAITIVAPTRAQNPLATHATKFGQSIFHGERIYSINSSSPVAQIALIIPSTSSCSFFGSFSILAALFAAIFFISVFSDTDFSIVIMKNKLTVF